MRWLLRLPVAGLLCAWIGLALWQPHRRLPPGEQIDGPWQSLQEGQPRFLRDLSSADATGAPFSDQQIDAEILRMISQARELIVIDTGLFGDLPAAGPGAPRLRSARPLAATLTDALLKVRRERGVQELLLVDPSSLQLQPGAGPIERLREAGAAVVAIDVDRLRAADAPFASLWRLCCRWWAPASAMGDWPNPAHVGPARISFGLWGRLADYQRSHRQLLIADDGSGGLSGLIFSRALNAEAAMHSATALQLGGPVLSPLLESEFVLAQFSGWSGGGAMQALSQRLVERHEIGGVPALPPPGSARARVVSEAALSGALARRIDAAGSHDNIEIAALYLSQRNLVRALLEAARRGAAVRVLIDPGKDGYGYERTGLPNREVASELVAASDGAVRVRWYRTHGEQFSAGLVMVRTATRCWLEVGTADLGRRDLDDFNLAAGFIADLPAGAPASIDALSWFDTLWFNRAGGGTEYTSDVDVYADASQLDYWQYRMFEAAGVSFD